MILLDLVFWQAISLQSLLKTVARFAFKVTNFAV